MSEQNINNSSQDNKTDNKPKLMFTPTEKYDFDLIVLGGGSGGIKCSRTAAQLGAKVAVLDFVKPSTIGTKWGLGGTCVNVGCIPKKLMHTAAIAGDRIEDSVDFGWKLIDDKEKFLKSKQDLFSWEKLVNNVQLHIKSLNFKYKVDLKGNKVKYFNCLGSFVDEHTIEAVDKKGKKQIITAENIVVAVGGRPSFPDDVEGAKEFCISSDDLFSLKKAPGKTLVVGASYVALECAGFLTGIGFDTTVMIRSVPLRGFDSECAQKIRDNMEHHGTKMLQPYSPLKISKLENGKLKCDYKNNKTGETHSDEFDTIMFATGRTAVTSTLNLDKVGVKTDVNGKIIVNDEERSTQSNIYAIGDVISGGLELTPVAIQAGKLLANRLYGGKTTKMDYINVPTTVFTPLEYGSCGLPEEKAKEIYGEQNLKIYLKNYHVLEYQVPHRETQAFLKLICDAKDNERVVGFHYLGPNAGEMTQAIGISMRLGATKDDFDSTVGIHPTCAETMTTLVYGQTEDSGC